MMRLSLSSYGTEMVSFVGGMHIDPAALTKSLTILAALALSATTLYLMIGSSKKQHIDSSQLASPPDEVLKEPYDTASEEYRDSVAIADEDLGVIFNATQAITMAADRLKARNQPSSTCRASSPIPSSSFRSIGVSTEDLPTCSSTCTRLCARSRGEAVTNCGCTNAKPCVVALGEGNTRPCDAFASTIAQQNCSQAHEGESSLSGEAEMDVIDEDYIKQTHPTINHDDDSMKHFEGYVHGTLKKHSSKLNRIGASGGTRDYAEEKGEEVLSVCFHGKVVPRVRSARNSLHGGQAQDWKIKACTRPCEGTGSERAERLVEERREQKTSSRPLPEGRISGVREYTSEPSEAYTQTEANDVEDRREAGAKTTSNSVDEIGVPRSKDDDIKPFSYQRHPKVREEITAIPGDGYGVAGSYVEERDWEDRRFMPHHPVTVEPRKKKARNPDARGQWKKVHAAHDFELLDTGVGPSTIPSTYSKGANIDIFWTGMPAQDDLRAQRDSKKILEGEHIPGCPLHVKDKIVSPVRPSTKVAHLRGRCSEFPSSLLSSAYQIEYAAEMSRCKIQRCADIDCLQAQQKKGQCTPNAMEPSSDNQNQHPQTRSKDRCPNHRPLTSYAHERPLLQSQAAKATITHAQEVARSTTSCNPCKHSNSQSCGASTL